MENKENNKFQHLIVISYKNYFDTNFKESKEGNILSQISDAINNILYNKELGSNIIPYYINPNLPINELVNSIDEILDAVNYSKNGVYSSNEINDKNSYNDIVNLLVQTASLKEKTYNPNNPNYVDPVENYEKLRELIASYVVNFSDFSNLLLQTSRKSLSNNVVKNLQDVGNGVIGVVLNNHYSNNDESILRMLFGYRDPELTREIVNNKLKEVNKTKPYVSLLGDELNIFAKSSLKTNYRIAGR